MIIFCVNCHKCGKKFGWSGEAKDRPPCPKCKHLPDLKLLKYDKEQIREVREYIAKMTTMKGEYILEKKSEMNEKYVRPRVVCLCGSSRFKDVFIRVSREETLARRIVIGTGEIYGHIDKIDMNGPIKEMLDELHLHRIDISDEILVINVDGYIGESTRKEIEYARREGKLIRYLEKHE